MRGWFVTRNALAVALWMLWCSGSQSSSQEWTQRKTVSTPMTISRAVSSTMKNSSSMKNTMNTSETNVCYWIPDTVTRIEGMFSSHYLLDIRGGRQDDASTSSSSSSNALVPGMNMSVSVEEEGVVDIGHSVLDDDDEAVVSQDDMDDNSTALANTTTSLSRKVSAKLKQWKKAKKANNNSNNSKKKIDFLDRVALMSDTLLKKEHDAVLEEEPDTIPDILAITHQSDLLRRGRYFTVVTTAALPWMTGTAVNPLLRAAHLVRKTQDINHNTTHQWVTLVVPWLELEQDRRELYGVEFNNEQEQEDYIRNWLRQEADMPDAACPDTGLKIRFYPARYHSGLKSIFAMGDVCAMISNDQADVCILEEPEHLNWYRAPGEGWTTKFHYVVGVVHTNYKEYASGHYSGLWTAPAIAVMSSAMVRAYCHKVIKLSDVLQTFAPEKEETSNVHGVRSEFLKEGLRRANEVVNVVNNNEHNTRVYFIGKLLWAKGLDLLLDLEEYYKQCTGDYFAIDIYGSGPDEKDIYRSYHGRRNSKNGGDEEEAAIRIIEDDDNDEIASNGSVLTVQFKTRKRLQRIKETIKATTESLEFDLPKSLHELRRQPIPATFPGRVDHAVLKQHDIFVNPSITEVLCTTTAEALAMGKFAIIPVHPSNTFFLRFPNCLAYRNKFEFVANLRWALTHRPEPLTPELAREFTWEAATDRFVQASAITHREALEREKLGKSKLDERIAWFHNELGKGATGDALRKVLGAGPASHQVKYQVAQQATLDELGLDEESEDEDEGLPKKLRMSSFAAAVRTTLANGLPSLKVGTG